MAERRMFAKTIIDSDAFLDMPQSSQLLYFHLAMRADDDGFINNPKSIMRNVKCNEDDLKLLIVKKFLIPFESGVVVIKHWRIHNYIRSDRYKETKYKEEKASLGLDENNAYTQSKNDLVDKMDTNGIPVVYQMDTQYGDTQDRLGKDRLELNNINNVQKDTSKADARELFEKLWKLYPVKKGKGQVSDTAKIRLLKIGEEELLRAIERYKTELEKDADWRKPQNGSTFFNSGYVDYLDENYVPGKKDKPKNKNNNFKERDYDFSKLEKDLLNNG